MKRLSKQMIAAIQSANCNDCILYRKKKNLFSMIPKHYSRGFGAATIEGLVDRGIMRYTDNCKIHQKVELVYYPLVNRASV